MPQTELIQPTAAGQARAVGLLCAGLLVAFPTETVYGLGADATDDRAVARVFQAKGRPRFNPLIVHVPDIVTASSIAVFDESAQRLADAFWPGALTLVLPLRPEAGIAPLVTAGLPSIALRVPDHPLAQDLMRRVGRPIAAPSANPSGKISPTSAHHVLGGLNGRIEAVLDGGSCPVGVESTIIGLLPDPTLLRAGGLPVEAVEACLGAPLALPSETAQPTAPGQLASHYAPRATVRLNAERADAGERLLGFGPVKADLNLSPTGDLVEAAANLFQHLHMLDAADNVPIAVSAIPDCGLGRAINDRLRRAAAQQSA